MGDRVRASAEGFSPNGSIGLFLGSKSVATRAANARGEVRAWVPIPVSTPPGDAWISAVDIASGVSAQARLSITVPVQTQILQVQRADGTAWTLDEMWLTSDTVADLRQTWRTRLASPEPGATYPPSVWGEESYGQEVTVWALVDGAIVATWDASYRRADGTDHDRTIIASLDARTGSITWQRAFDRQPFASGFGVVATEGSIVLAHAEAQRLLALEATTGADRWSRRGASLFVSLGRVILVTLSGPDPGPGLYAVDARSGKPRWRADLEQTDRIGRLAADDDVVAVEWMNRPGRWTIIAFDARTGTQRWSWTRATDADENLVVTSDAVIVGGSSIAGDAEVRSLDRSDGSTRWRWVFPREDATEWVWAQPAGANDASVFVLAARCFQLESCDGDQQLVALDRESGSVRWSIALREALTASGPVRPTVGPISLTDSLVATSGGPVLLEATTGDVLRSVDISHQEQPFPPRPGAPVLADGRMFTASETAVVAFEVSVRPERPDPAELAATTYTTPTGATAPTSGSAGTDRTSTSAGTARWQLLGGVVVLAAIACGSVWLRSRRAPAS